MSSAYVEACNKKGLKPLKEVVQSLDLKSQELKISSRTQTVRVI